MSGGGSPPPAPDYVGAAREQGRLNLEALRAGAALNRVNERNPFGSTTYKDLGGDRWEQTTELSPEQQAIFDLQQQNQTNMGSAAAGRLGQVANQGAFNLNGLPSQVTGVQESNVGGIPVEQRDIAGARQRAEDATYGAATRMLDPQFQQQGEATRTRLLNQGLREGSEAWNNEMAALDRTKQAAYGDARDRAIQAGGSEASRMLSDALRVRQSDMDRAGQQFGERITNAELTNQGRATGINERLTERNIPMQEFLQLYGGGGAGQGMNSGAAANVGSPAPVDYMGAINNQYGAQTDMYNYRQQRNAQNTQTGISLASIAAMMAMSSDRRAKESIARVGILPNGIPTYRYRYKGESQERLGVMSDDVRQIRPDAVTVGDDGYDRVNYAAIGAEHLLEAV